MGDDPFHQLTAIVALAVRLDEGAHRVGIGGETEDIARACLFLCDEANDFLNGQTLTIDGGATIRMIYPE